MLLFLFFSMLAEATWHPERLRFVDQVGQGYLFRGSAPVVDGAFDFDALHTTMVQAAKNQSVVLPTSFDLKVVSMLISLKKTEADELKAEETYFSQKFPGPLPGPGSALTHWPIIGDVVSPHIYPKSACLSKAKAYDSSGDHMVTKTRALRAMLENATVPTVVYFHCDAGEDRTGELYGDYSMYFRIQTYSEVLAYDDSIETRKINTVNKQALEWMCLYLQEEVPNVNPMCNVCQ
mmetsp:Transcript_18576/g.36341  ORF Transcript_18576/g.36341 Transcript_18576/m.36341 type:complete len:235 (+) Transcript_18576:61-765(+)|eukprot:CAMPEP_0175142782 /NCGR_PEP_ID=MMETSP0087-20121206/13018_1 /TAXON_ID=136419 /ORGANISM="Unknown Unknown, Strain D1" /LENGTH=234 /DNA_ID=CAMNT_0016426679 /DNA_START=66 /DNA_END=770 /DNA_ORIENTATION=-